MKNFCLLFSLFAYFMPLAQAANPQDYRTQTRARVISNAKKGSNSESPHPNDQARDLVDELKYENLQEIESKGFLKASLPASPWSGSYWPTYAGHIANRYGDPRYMPVISWKDNSSYLKSVIGQGSDSELSPAEKYDLLIGDADFTLTNRMIMNGGAYSAANGNVESWFGLCHGWAPAAFMLPRPYHSVSVRAADGRMISFTPDDLKALGTLLWANGTHETKFIGGRCNKKDNRGNLDPKCRDTNPATWHLAAVNQIAGNGRSFVMDATAGYEVWNQPVFGYKYYYFHPITKKAATRLRDAKIKMENYANDPHSGKRAPGTAYIVNINMEVDYLNETTPRLVDYDSSADDSHRAVLYSYDLELDENDNILGGEWIGEEHPDFLWLPVEGSHAISRGDSWLESRNNRYRWNGQESIPTDWKTAAKISSANEQALARIVERLFELASQQAQLSGPLQLNR